MSITMRIPAIDFDLSAKVFHDLMARKVNDILLVSSPYDAFIMEEDGRLAQRIIDEYRGLNLSRPPRITWVSTAHEAFDTLSRKRFDLVLTMPSLDDMDPYRFGTEIRKRFSNLPVFMLAHNLRQLPANGPGAGKKSAIDQLFVWTGNTDLLLAIVKNVEDSMNVVYDTQRARVRVIILVEDSPLYRSSLMPLLYREIVLQTQAVMDESLNAEHRLLRMRARPKILLADHYEQALELYRQHKPYILAMISDVRFPHSGRIDPQAGFDLLSQIKKDSDDIPLLMFSSEEHNRAKATRIPAVFLNKNSPSLHTEIRSFFQQYCGFGEFIFRMPDGQEVVRVASLRAMEKALASIPEESVYYHATRNHFSTWLMARSEIQLASKLRPIKASDFKSAKELQDYLIACLRERRKKRQRGVITDFVPDDFDPDAEFVKIGKGSLGGKARGLAFISTLLKQQPELQKKYPNLRIAVPKTLVISTEGFNAFIQENDLRELTGQDLDDNQISQAFLKARFPEPLQKSLALYLQQINYPLAVRSSSLLEDAWFQPFAGLYKTYMLPNNHPDAGTRLNRLINAIKLVYASTYLKAPRAFATGTAHRTEEEQMAVVIQRLTGRVHGDYFYPAMAGVAQSFNFYPIAYMRPEEGIAHVAFGLGKIVVEGGVALRFSPKYPQFLPQFSSVDDILHHSQHWFYALNLTDFPAEFGTDLQTSDNSNLSRLEIDDVRNHEPLLYLSSTYIPDDHRIRDFANASSHLVLTFARILKYNDIPLPEMLSDVLEMGRKGLGGPVEMEFALNLPDADDPQAELAILQIRPMAMMQQHLHVHISDGDLKGAICYSHSAMGNGVQRDLTDIVFVKPDDFDPSQTIAAAAEIARINASLLAQKRKYLLVGPGRWGSADRWLGIPVTWNDISGVGAIIETCFETLRADPSQGSHFFHNITSMGISYITLGDGRDNQEFLDWRWLKALPAQTEGRFVRHTALPHPLILKVDGKSSHAVIMPSNPATFSKVQ